MHHGPCHVADCEIVPVEHHDAPLNFDTVVIGIRTIVAVLQYPELIIDVLQDINCSGNASLVPVERLRCKYLGPPLSDPHCFQWRGVDLVQGPIRLPLSRCCSVTLTGEGSEECPHNGSGGTVTASDDRRGERGASDRTRLGDRRVMDRGMTDQVTVCWWRTPIELTEASCRVGSKDTIAPPTSTQAMKRWRGEAIKQQANHTPQHCLGHDIRCFPIDLPEHRINTCPITDLKAPVT